MFVDRTLETRRRCVLIIRPTLRLKMTFGPSFGLRVAATVIGMLRTAAGTDEALMSASALIDLSRLITEHGVVSVALDSVARDLRNLWACTLASGNVCEIEGIVEASHAVHRAAAALREDILIPSR